MRLFTRLGNEQDMLHEKDYIGAVTKAREDEDLLALQGVPEGLNNLHNFTSRGFLGDTELRRWLCT